MKEKIWYLRNDFTKLPAKDILESTLEDDRKNYDRAITELEQEIKILDEAIILFIQSLQAAYIQIDKWKTNNSNRASIAMLVSVLNYILVARHMVLLGYFPEIQEILRSCHERTSRSYLFFYSLEYANKFLSGEQIKQATVDDELSKLEKDPDKKSDIYRDLRKYYRDYLSGVAHPNLKSFEYRNGSEDLSSRVGLYPLLGGIMSSERGYIVITIILQTTLVALRLFKAMIEGESGEWDTRFEALNRKYKEMMNKIVSNNM
jgi:hypothetical protein